MQRLTFTLEPVDGPFPVPYSTGYQAYSGLLSVLSDEDETLAEAVHEADTSSLTNSGLHGPFDPRGADREYHQLLRDDEYTLHLGATHPQDEELFEALVRAFVIQDRHLPLAHGELAVRSVQSESTTIPELREEAAAAANDATGVQLQFLSPTCIQQHADVWEAFPSRTHLFPAIAARWNAVADNPEHELDPAPDTVGQELYAVPDPNAYNHHSIVVHRQDPSTASAEDGQAVADGGGNHIRECQGFVGEWTFRFKDASTATRTAVIALSRFAEYSGVGRHNARGAGTVRTTVEGIDS